MGRVDYGYQPYGHATISLQWKPGDGIRVPTDHRGVTPPLKRYVPVVLCFSFLAELHVGSGYFFLCRLPVRECELFTCGGGVGGALIMDTSLMGMP